MKTNIAYKMVKTYSKGDKNYNHEIVAIESDDNYWGEAGKALAYARALADEYVRYGADCESHPELDIINGYDELIIDIYPVVLIDGVEVETDDYTMPIQSLTVSEPALRHYSEMLALRDEYNRVNMRSVNAYTSLY